VKAVAFIRNSYPIGVVPKKNGSSWLIISMQLLNVAISPPHFKYKDLALLAPLLKRETT